MLRQERLRFDDDAAEGTQPRDAMFSIVGFGKAEQEMLIRDFVGAQASRPFGSRFKDFLRHVIERAIADGLGHGEARRIKVVCVDRLFEIILQPVEVWASQARTIGGLAERKPEEDVIGSRDAWLATQADSVHESEFEGVGGLFRVVSTPRRGGCISHNMWGSIVRVEVDGSGK